MSVLIFGNQEFVSEIADKINAPVVGMAYDRVTAMEMLETHDAEDVIVNFQDEFAFEMSEIYRSKRFFLAMPAEKITAQVYKQALAQNIRIVDISKCIEAINAEILKKNDCRRESIKPPETTKISRTPLKAHTVVFTSIKGGVGKTVMAVSLAAYIADWARKKKIDYKVCLVDCDAEGARTAAMWLGISKVPQSLTVWSQLEREPSWMDLEHLLVYHRETGLYVLPGPQSFKDALETELTATLAERIITALHWHFDLVVLDLGIFIKNDTALRAMQIATKTFLVVEPTLITLKLLNELISENVLGKQGVDLSRVKLILNMNDKSTFTARDIERSFGIQITANIDYEKQIKKFENSGKNTTPVLALPNSKFAKEIASLARTVIENEITPNENGLLERLKMLFKRGVS